MLEMPPRMELEPSVPVLQRPRSFSAAPMLRLPLPSELLLEDRSPRTREPSPRTPPPHNNIEMIAEFARQGNISLTPTIGSIPEVPDYGVHAGSNETEKPAENQPIPASEPIEAEPERPQSSPTRLQESQPDLPQDNQDNTQTQQQETLNEEVKDENKPVEIDSEEHQQSYEEEVPQIVAHEPRSPPRTPPYTYDLPTPPQSPLSPESPPYSPDSQYTNEPPWSPGPSIELDSFLHDSSSSVSSTSSAREKPIPPPRRSPIIDPQSKLMARPIMRHHQVPSPKLYRSNTAPFNRQPGNVRSFASALSLTGKSSEPENFANVVLRPIKRGPRSPGSPSQGEDVTSPHLSPETPTRTDHSGSESDGSQSRSPSSALIRDSKELVHRAHDLVSRTNNLVNRSNDLVSRTNEGMTKSGELMESIYADQVADDQYESESSGSSMDEMLYGRLRANSCDADTRDSSQSDLSAPDYSVMRSNSSDSIDSTKAAIRNSDTESAQSFDSIRSNWTRHIEANSSNDSVKSSDSTTSEKSIDSIKSTDSIGKSVTFRTATMQRSPKQSSKSSINLTTHRMAAPALPPRPSADPRSDPLSRNAIFKNNEFGKSGADMRSRSISDHGGGNTKVRPPVPPRKNSKGERRVGMSLEVRGSGPVAARVNRSESSPSFSLLEKKETPEEEEEKKKQESRPLMDDLRAFFEGKFK